MKLSIGSKIALAIVVAAGVLVAWAGVRALRFLGTEEGQEMLRAARLGQESVDGPGSRQLRALGCEQPVITDFKSLVSTAPARYPPGIVRRANETDAGEAPVVICQDLLGRLLSCERVARTYAAATSPSQSFLVSVVRGIEAKCSSVAAPTGDLIGPTNAESLASLGERSDSLYSVVITGLRPEWRIRAIKAVRRETGLGLADAKRMVEETPSTARTGLARREAEAIVARLREQGLTVELEPE